MTRNFADLQTLQSSGKPHEVSNVSIPPLIFYLIRYFDIMVVKKGRGY